MLGSGLWIMNEAFLASHSCTVGTLGSCATGRPVVNTKFR
jgi:hypothetical protein